MYIFQEGMPVSSKEWFILSSQVGSWPYNFPATEQHTYPGLNKSQGSPVFTYGRESCICYLCSEFRFQSQLIMLFDFDCYKGIVAKLYASLSYNSPGKKKHVCSLFTLQPGYTLKNKLEVKNRINGIEDLENIKEWLPNSISISGEQWAAFSIVIHIHHLNF